MSYNHQNIDYWLTAPGTAGLLSAVVDPIAAVVPYRMGYQPVMTVAIYGLVTVATTVTVATVQFKFRPTMGSATGEIVIGTLNFPIGTAINTMVYKTVDNVKCLPGGEIVASVTVAATAGAAHLGVLVSPNWDSPGNNLKMLRSL
jgi:hypothetical protein